MLTRRKRCLELKRDVRLEGGQNVFEIVEFSGTFIGLAAVSIWIERTVRFQFL